MFAALWLLALPAGVGDLRVPAATTDTTQEETAPLSQNWVRASVKGNVGVLANTLPPFVVPGPGLSAGFEVGGSAARNLFIEADVGLGFGLQDGSSPIGGYSVRGRFGFFHDMGTISLRADAHVLIDSVLFIPVPRIGVGGALAWRYLEVDVGDRSTLSLELGAGADVEPILPGLHLDLGTALRFRIPLKPAPDTERLELGLRLGADADALAPLIYAAASVNGIAEGWLNYRF